MKVERRAAVAALHRYMATANPPAVLVHELLTAVALMVAIDTDRKVSYVVDGYALVREPISLYGRRGSGA